MECGQGGTTARLTNEGDGAVVKDTGASDVRLIDILWTPEHIGAWMPIKHELPFPVSQQGNKSESRPRLGGEP